MIAFILGGGGSRCGATEEASEKAARDFLAGFNCSEATLMALGGSLGTRSNLIPRIATYFGGGIGGTHRYICGAVSAGVMAMGIAFGRDRLSDDRSKGNDLTRRLLKEFEEEFGSLTCCQLVGLDPSDKDWAAKFTAQKIREEKCVHYVRFVVERWLELAENIL